MSWSLPALALALPLLAACEGGAGEPEPAAPPTVSAEDVERYRTDVLVRMQATDGAIAALEAEADGADSATAVAYGRALTTLRARRQAVQARLDSLQTLTPTAFERATAALDERVGELDRRVGNARVWLARDAGQLRQAAQARLEAFDREAQALPADSARDTQRALAELEQRRQQIEADLARLDGPGVAFDSLRVAVTNHFDRLFERAAALRAGSRPSERLSEPTAPTPE